MIELELMRDFFFLFLFLFVNNMNEIIFGFMNETNFLDMNFLYLYVTS